MGASDGGASISARTQRSARSGIQLAFRAGRRTALFTTGPAPFEHLPEVVSVSRNLADRRALGEDLRSVDAEVYLVELKAAAIDMVAEAAAARGARLVFADNEVVAPELDARLLALADQAVPA